MPKRIRPLHKRLWSRVQVRSGDACWPFIGPTYPAGYGKIGVGLRGGGVMPASRAAWLVTYGPIPAGMEICHHCDNPPCCRPDHLFLGTRAENMQDASRKNRLRGPLTWQQREAIIAAYTAGFATAKALGEAYGVTQSAVENMTYAHRRRSTAKSLGS